MLNTAIIEYAINKANEGTLQHSDIELKHFPGKIGYANEFVIAESVCELMGVSEKLMVFVLI